MGSMTTRQQGILRFFVICGFFLASLAFVALFTRVLLQWTT
jgi:hypothetical protein